MKNSVDRGARCYWPRWITPKFKNKLKHADPGRCKVHTDNASLLGSFGDQGLFGAANILQIADFVCQVVFLLFLPCF